ncbi:hypothetical protein [Desulfosporosinus metallidurans]|uniref:Uncharacterized protein n=1 Tax=Desulfosporosinus metallidurans TaxID=1888891 RepID=A0A1Q8R2N0_9FIRM|nr:hypothetical protein [Desulfosporosinus metallidurans]OLN33844.1 hypothetical protein DSOL_0022 [Desulfosporosinus metallidurans]
MTVKTEVFILAVTNTEQDTQNISASESSGDILYVVESVISRDDLIHGRFTNKQEKIVYERPESKTASVNRNIAIVEFLNSIYESILQEEAGGLKQ